MDFNACNGQNQTIHIHTNTCWLFIYLLSGKVSQNLEQIISTGFLLPVYVCTI